MSSSSQKQFLLKLQKELEIVSSTSGNEKQRQLFNQRGHVFIVTSRGIKKGLREGIVKAFTDGTLKEARAFASNVSRQSDTDILKFIASLTRRYRVQEKQGKVRILRVTNRKLTVLVYPEGDVFKRIKGVYNSPLNTLFNKINHRAKGILTQRGQLFNLEHRTFQGILETTVRDTIDNVLNDLTADGNTLANVKKFFKSQGVDISVIRNTKTDRMEVFLGSTVSNQAERQLAQTKKKSLLEVLNKSIEKLQNDPAFAFEELKGSDSFKTKKRKQTIQTVVKPFKGKKNIKVTTEDIKIKNSNTKVSRKITPKVAVINKSKTSRVRRAKVSSFNLGKLLGVLNQQLPSVVAKNMGDPALNYRTGRFASGVRATDISRTPQGFASVGYTYQLYPYQTFEPGYAQGDPDRDPRKLIDRSIREIMAQFAIGRFYTRRQ